MIGSSATIPATLPPGAPGGSQAVASVRAPAGLAGPPLREGEQVPMPAEVSFGEFLSALNPLHHIPVVGWIYRQVTGETIQPVFRVLGGLLTGGPIGAIASAVATLAEELLGGAHTGSGPAGGGTALAEAPPAAPGPAVAAAAVAAAAVPGAAFAPGSLAAIVTASGQPLQPLPLATRLAARAYPSPPLPMRETAQPPDPAAGFVPAAAALPKPERAEAAADATAPEPTAPEPTAPAAPAAPAAQTRVRRAPLVPVSSGGQNPAFMQQMMRGLEAYERSMRARTAPQPMPAAATP